MIHILLAKWCFKGVGQPHIICPTYASYYIFTATYQAILYIHQPAGAKALPVYTFNIQAANRKGL